MEHRRKLIHITKMPIRWGDMDAYGHVNNTIYFRYMEQARVELIEDMQVVVRPGGDGPVIINASCTFLVPMTYPGMVEVRTYVGAIGRSSFQTYVEMRIDDRHTVYGVGMDANIVSASIRAILSGLQRAPQIQAQVMVA